MDNANYDATKTNNAKNKENNDVQRKTRMKQKTIKQKRVQTTTIMQTIMQTRANNNAYNLPNNDA